MDPSTENSCVQARPAVGLVPAGHPSARRAPTGRLTPGAAGPTLLAKGRSLALDRRRVRQAMRRVAVLWFAAILGLGHANDGIAGPATELPLATDAEVAEFWDTVFNGPPPYGAPPVHGLRSNRREARGVILWDVRFDSYQDPVTGRPARLGGVFAVPSETPSPAANGRFPGLVVSHSLGVRNPKPSNKVELATFFAAKGYATLAFYLRGYGTSRLVRPRSGCGGYFCANLPAAREPPLDTVWAGFAVDAFQAGEFLAAQPEVLDPNGLAFIGHSLGGFIALNGGIFSGRFKVIVASAPAATTPDPVAWMDYWKGAPWVVWADKQPDPAGTKARLARMWSFVGTYRSLNNSLLAAKNPDWMLGNAAVFLYGGERDPAVPASDIEAAYWLADESNEKVLYRSPTGAHGGMEAFVRGQAWLAGHYPGRTIGRPAADLRVVRKVGRAVEFSAERSRGESVVMTWFYEFGDGTTRHWGATLSHTYARPGMYTATVTVIDGAGQRDTASVTVRVD